MCENPIAEDLFFEEEQNFDEYYRDITGEDFNDRDDIDIGTAYHEYYDDDEFEEVKYDKSDWSFDPQ